MSNNFLNTLAYTILAAWVLFELRALVLGCAHTVLWPADVKLRRVKRTGKVVTEAYVVPEAERLTLLDRLTMLQYAWFTRSVMFHELHHMRFNQKPKFYFRPSLFVAVVTFLGGLTVASGTEAFTLSILAAATVFASSELRSVIQHYSATDKSSVETHAMLKKAKATQA